MITDLPKGDYLYVGRLISSEKNKNVFVEVDEEGGTKVTPLPKEAIKEIEDYLFSRALSEKDYLYGKPSLKSARVEGHGYWNSVHVDFKTGKVYGSIDYGDNEYSNCLKMAKRHIDNKKP